MSVVIDQSSADLTLGAAFARLRDAAGLAMSAEPMYRAEVAELADARGSGPRTRKGVGVRVPSSAPSELFMQRMSRLRVALVVWSCSIQDMVGPEGFELPTKGL